MFPYGQVDADGDGCGCYITPHCLDIKLTLAIKYNEVVIYRKEHPITHSVDLPEFWAEIFWIHIPDSVALCVCGELAIKDQGQCKKCYLDCYTRTEEEGGDRSICLENKGVWFKTECGHIFHAHCIIKALNEKNQCPLCRTRINHCVMNMVMREGGQVNPYNV